MQTTKIIIYTFCYAMFFVLSWISKLNNYQRLILDKGGYTSKPGNLIAFHVIGILWLGVVPLILLQHSMLKLLTGNEMPGGIFIFIFILIFTLIISIAFKQSVVYMKNQGSPEGLINLSSTFFIRYFIIRALFLFVYELWFRGFLLFDCIRWAGIPVAVSVIVFLHVLVHIFNSKKEMWACIPFGLLVCFLNILFNAAWPAIILHIGFSLVYEFNIYRSHFYTIKIARS